MHQGLRRFLMGLATVSGLARRGFFIPYRFAHGIPGPGRRPAYAAAENILRRREEDFRAFLRIVDGFAPDLARIGSEARPAPRWRQDWFPRLDGAAAYAMVRSRAPGRIVEVGSGHSTRFLARAAADGGLATRITAIDPAPRADLTALDVALIRKTVQEAGMEAFAGLAAGDFLMIDSSHVAMPGSDVDLLINHVLPGLPAGVVVHVHDVFLPDDYPPEWEWRGYNEQLLVAPLIHGGGYRVLFASRYVATRMKDTLAGTSVADLPLSPGAYESSLWLQTTEDHSGLPGQDRHLLHIE